jgi:hypothetical protein
MEWYGPLTILPAIGLIILSTSNFIIALNTEIGRIETEKEPNRKIIMQKVIQLRRLGIANAFLYSSALLFLFSSLVKAFFNSTTGFQLLMISGAFMATVALAFLFTHSIRAVQIRHEHLKLK